MKKSINRIIPNIFIILALLFFVSCNQGCLMFLPSTIDKNIMLTKRVEKAYQYYKERQFEKFINFFDRGFYAGINKRERIDKFEKGLPILVEYRIKEIKINGEKAIVKVENTYKFESKETKEILIMKDISVDYWIFKDDEWYLYEFGKGE